MDKRSSPEAVAKRAATMRARLGVSSAMQCRDVVDKSNATKIERFGCAKVPGSGRKKMTVDEFIKRAREIHGDKYDYSRVVMSGTAVKVEIICPDHGVFLQTPAKHLAGRGCCHKDCIAAKKAATTQVRFGVDNAMRSAEVVEKRSENRKAKRCVEDAEWAVDVNLYNALCNIFENDDVICNYKLPGCDFYCDFYIRSRDMLIDSWVSSQRADSSKFAVMRAVDSNYIIFCDEKLRDFDVWVSLNCPDGRDWRKSYSWLPERDIHGMDLNGLPMLSSNYKDLSLIAKAYQFHVFYEREEAVWRENQLIRSGLPIQLFLYYNRLKYKNMTPVEISDLQLMRAFTISGVMKGYTVFDSRLMDAVIKKYDIMSVYDPCAGWGERALYCKANDMSYLGVDINWKLFDGYCAMQEFYSMTDQQFVCGDSGSLILSGNCDAVLTCPPYGDTEIYSPEGAENLASFDFLDWWRRVVENSLGMSPKYFCFQISRKWRDSMSDIVRACNFELIDELFYPSARASHFNRQKDGVSKKREYESMLVFRRT